MSYLDGVDESERIAKEFWANSARRKRLEEEAAEEGAKADTPLEHFVAMLRFVWTDNNLMAVALNEPIRWGPQDLDEWLAEDNPRRLSPWGTPGVLEALGI